MTAPLALRLSNLVLLVLFPVAWFAPLMSVATLFKGREISIISGLQALWETDPALALVVTLFAIFAPMAKVAGLALIHWRLLKWRVLPVLTWLGKLAMADVFLVALYIVVAKGIGVGRIETAWGLWLFTGLILASLALSAWTARLVRRPARPAPAGAGSD